MTVFGVCARTRKSSCADRTRPSVHATCDFRATTSGWRIDWNAEASREGRGEWRGEGEGPTISPRDPSKTFAFRLSSGIRFTATRRFVDFCTVKYYTPLAFFLIVSQTERCTGSTIHHEHRHFHEDFFPLFFTDNIIVRSYVCIHVIYTINMLFSFTFLVVSLVSARLTVFFFFYK